MRAPPRGTTARGLPCYAPVDPHPHARRDSVALCAWASTRGGVCAACIVGWPARDLCASFVLVRVTCTRGPDPRLVDARSMPSMMPRARSRASRTLGGYLASQVQVSMIQIKECQLNRILQDLDPTSYSLLPISTRYLLTHSLILGINLGMGYAYGRDQYASARLRPTY